MQAIGAEEIGSMHECATAALILGSTAKRCGWDLDVLWSFLEMDSNYMSATWYYVCDGMHT